MCVEKDYRFNEYEPEVVDINLIISLIDSLGVSYEPSGKSVKKVLDFASQYDVIETQVKLWEINKN